MASMPRFLSVKNFDRYQHYKDRAPTWIKLYNALLDDYTFLSLAEPLQRHLLMIWLIASRLENRIPYDETFIRRAIHARGRVDLDTLVASGFLIPMEQNASTVLAEPAQNARPALANPENGASPRVRPRARGETEGEKEKEPPVVPRDEIADEFAPIWPLYPKRNGGNSQPDAQAAFGARRKEGVAVAVLRDGTVRYAVWCDATGKTGTELVMQGKRFYGKGRHYDEPWDLPDDSLEARARSIREAQDAEEARWNGRRQ